METIDIKAAVRKETKKKDRNVLRKQNLIPAVVYGKDISTLNLQVDKKDIIKILKSEAGVNTILNLKVEGEKEHPAIIHALDKDPVKDTIRNVDFLHINIHEKITTHVPVHLEGTSPGQKEGGILLHSIHEITIKCLPTEIPPHIDVDISNLNMWDTIKIKDLSIAEGIEVIHPADEEAIVVTVKEPSAVVEEEEVPAEGEAVEGAEPEVIEKGKKAEEGEEGAAPKEEAKGKEEKEGKEGKEGKAKK
ncbi:50S ribosomal protein L25 [Candidatus Margulisiibacteriota bacterium]